MRIMTNPFLKPDVEKECTDFEERAAIMEFEGGLLRKEAERLAKESSLLSEQEKSQ